MKKFEKYIKLVFIIVIAYLISNFSNENIFISNSPKINPYFRQNLIAKASKFWLITKNYISFKNSFNNSSSKSGVVSPPPPSSKILVDVTEILNTPLSEIGPGVYAGEKNDIKIFEFKMKEIEYLEYTYNIKGKIIKIKVPKGVRPPRREVIEKIYK